MGNDDDINQYLEIGSLEFGFSFVLFPLAVILLLDQTRRDLLALSQHQP